jgi:hypothetical protein
MIYILEYKDNYRIICDEDMMIDEVLMKKDYVLEVTDGPGPILIRKKSSIRDLFSSPKGLTVINLLHCEEMDPRL